MVFCLPSTVTIAYGRLGVSAYTLHGVARGPSWLSYPHFRELWPWMYVRPGFTGCPQWQAQVFLCLSITHYLGDNFSYTDSIEVSYGLPARKFSSFKEAASEAAISRFYGGIHFMDAIENGFVQGSRLGEWIIKKLKFLIIKRNPPPPNINKQGFLNIAKFFVF